MRIGLLTSVPLTLHAFFLEWIDRWESNGIQVFPASGPESDLLVPARIPNYTQIGGLSQFPQPQLVLSLRQLQRWSSDSRLDVILTNTATASAAVRVRSMNCPIVYFCHGLHWSNEAFSLPNPYQAIERLLLRNTSAVITMNSDDGDWFSAHAGWLPRLHLPSGVGVELEDWPSTPNLPVGDPLRLAWIGALTKRKRPLDALEVVRKLNAHGISVELEMLGTGPLINEVRKQARHLEGVSIRGHVPALTAIRAANAVIHTAEWEGLPRVLLEATAVGRPTFGYDVKGVRDAPGTLTTPCGPSPTALADLLVAWLRGEVETPRVNRSSLDWRISHDAVTGLLKEVVTT